MAILIRPVAPYLLFEANSAYIATQLCVQKDNKDNKCNGQCFLMKRVKETSDSQDSERPLQSVEEEISFWQAEEALRFPILVSKTDLTTLPFDEGAKDQYFSELTVPPPQKSTSAENYS